MKQEMRKISEFIRLKRTVEKIKNETQFQIAFRRIEDAYASEKISYPEHQVLLRLLSDKSEEFDQFDKIERTD